MPINFQFHTEDIMLKIQSSAIAVLALSLTGCATEYQMEQPGYQYGAVEQPEYRTVERPRTEYRTVESSRQECWNEQVPVQSANPNYGGAILGGVAGGILGNQVGGGTGRTVATAAGAIAGAMVGDRMSANSAGYKTVRRCGTVSERNRNAREQGQVIRPSRPAAERDYYNEREERRRNDGRYESNDNY